MTKSKNKQPKSVGSKQKKTRIDFRNRKISALVFAFVFAVIGGGMYLYKTHAACSTCTPYRYQLVAQKSGYAAIYACKLSNTQASVRFNNLHSKYYTSVYVNGIRVSRLPAKQSYTRAIYENSKTTAYYYTSGSTEYYATGYLVSPRNLSPC